MPLFLIGWRFLGGRRFGIRTAIAVITYSFFVDFLVLFLPKMASPMTFSSILSMARWSAAFGYGLVYRARGTSGGSDILARILNHWRGVSMSASYLMVDSLVILGAGLVFGWKEALYALITLYVSGLVAETTLEGPSTVRTALIVTAQPETVSDASSKICPVA